MEVVVSWRTMEVGVLKKFSDEVKFNCNRSRIK